MKTPLRMVTLAFALLLLCPNLHAGFSQNSHGCFPKPEPHNTLKTLDSLALPQEMPNTPDTATAVGAFDLDVTVSSKDAAQQQVESASFSHSDDSKPRRKKTWKRLLRLLLRLLQLWLEKEHGGKQNWPALPLDLPRPEWEKPAQQSKSLPSIAIQPPLLSFITDPANNPTDPNGDQPPG